jgi:Bacterial Ig-like domain (group 1)
VLDTAAPTSKASAPSSASAGSTISVSYTASDGSGSGLSEVDLYAQAPGQFGYGKVASDTTGGTSGSFSYTLSAGAGPYSFYTIATDQAGNVQGAPSTPDATTNAVSAPSASTAAPSSVSYNAATLNGSVNPNGLPTNVHFEYGLDTPYGTSTPVQSAGGGNTMLPMNANVSGLVPNTLYHFRVVATNSAGSTFGADQTFTTPAAPDNTAPVSTASSPTYNTTTSWTVSYTASDNGGGDNVVEVDLYARGPQDSGYTKVASDTSGSASGSFSYSASEGDGSYSFYTIATDQAGNARAAPAGPQATTVLDTAAPTSKASAPSSASAGSTISVSYTASDGSGPGLAEVDLYAQAPGQSGYSKVSSDTSGSTSGSFSYALSAGAGAYSFYTIATDQAGNGQAAPSAPDASTTAVGAPSSVAVVSGSGQSATVGSAFSSSLAALVKDAAGNPVSGVTVTFAAPASGASGTFASGSATTTATTGSDGQATASAFSANSVAGSYSVSASVSGASPVSFGLTNTPGTSSSVAVVSGSGQSATVGGAFSSPLVALVTDAAGNPVSGVSVRFAAPSSGASGTFVNGSATTTATTGSDGQATSSAFTANSVAGA